MNTWKKVTRNEGKGHKEIKMCAGDWEWMVNFNWRNLKQFLKEKN